jgi:hypothetical protein
VHSRMSAMLVASRPHLSAVPTARLDYSTYVLFCQALRAASSPGLKSGDSLLALVEDMQTIFHGIAQVLPPGANVIVEISNLRVDGRFQTLAWDAARTLSALFTFEGEIVRCNSGPHEAGPGFDHSYLLVFTNQK